MKICIIGPGKKFLSGITYYTISLANEFSKTEEVSVVTLRNLLPKFLFPGSKRVGNNISSLDFNKNIKVFDGLDWYWFPSAFKIPRALKDNDVIILQWWTCAVAHTYLLVKFLNLFYRKKIIFEMHEVLDVMEAKMSLLNIYSKIMGKLLFTKKNKYVVHSESDKKLILKNYSISSENVFVVPHGSYNHYVKGESQKDSSIVNVLFFGLLRPYKGVDYLIEAFNKIKDKKYHLTIAGESWEGYSLKPMANDRITIINSYISDEEVNLLFQKADVLVLPYIRASQSGPAHIAIAYGIPIIASSVGGLKESMKSYKGATFVKPKDVLGLKEAILSVKKGIVYDNPHPWSETVKKYMKVLSE